MRKTILFIATSLDGYIADEEGNIDWLMPQVDIEEDDDTYEKFYEKVDTVIMGRTTYDQVTQELSPNEYPYEDAISYIITSKNESNLKNRIFTNTPVEILVSELVKQDGKDIWIVGGNSIVQPLVENNLIDEYIITTIPIILGEGIQLFKPFGNKIQLMHEQTSVKNGLVTSTFNIKK